jgi:hypothetical protein
MLNNLLNALPNIFGAFALIAIAYFVAGWSAGSSPHSGSLGFDRLFARIGLFREIGTVTPGASVSDTGGTPPTTVEAGTGEPSLPVRTTPLRSLATW